MASDMQRAHTPTVGERLRMQAQRATHTTLLSTRHPTSVLVKYDNRCLTIRRESRGILQTQACRHSHLREVEGHGAPPCSECAPQHHRTQFRKQCSGCIPVVLEALHVCV